MAYDTGRRVTLLQWRASTRGVALLAVAFFVEATSGCISNEYRIKKDELQRLAQLPPEARGASVRIGQTLGSRRGDAIEAPTAFQQTTVYPSDTYVDTGSNDHVRFVFANVGTDELTPARFGVQSVSYEIEAPPGLLDRIAGLTRGH